MNVLYRQWQDGFLDYELLPGQVRIAVDFWVVLCPIQDQYIVRARSLRTLLNYLRSVGPRYVWRKVSSRLRETMRNEKYYSVGFGTIQDSDSDGLNVGDSVSFVACNHPRLVDRLTVPQEFVRVAPNADWPREGEIVMVDMQDEPQFAGAKPHVAHSPFSGIPIDAARLQDYLRDISGRCGDWGYFVAKQQRFPKPTSPAMPTSPAPIVNTYQNSTAKGALPTGVIFGLGNYAKTNIIPNVRQRIQVAKVHEVDPLQLGRWEQLPYAADSSPLPREDELFDVYFAAGYHHTHARIARFALQRGRYAIVEKPLVTSGEQLEALRAELQHESKLFTCFHKRYAPYNQVARADLQLATGDPVSYYCIVYEIPLPTHHWYNWPNARSRIVSNGCHWIDHFMFLNDFAPVTQQELTTSDSGDIQVFLALENGAVFSMVMTDKGSFRTGVRDYIELRARDATVYISDGMQYLSERGDRLLRRRRFSKVDSYSRMYRQIAKRVAQGARGDSLESLRSAEVVLDLDRRVESSHP